MADELDDSFFEEEPSDVEETDSIFDDEIDELDEIIIENNEEERSNRPFMLALLGLLGIGVGAFLCLGAFQLLGFGGQADPTVSAEMLTVTVQVAAIEATNDAVATQNVYVTQTLEARDAQATANAVLPTNTPEPTETPVPTNSPVPVAAVGGSEEGAEASGDSEDTGAATGDSDNNSDNNADGGTDASADGGTDAAADGEDPNAQGGGGGSDTAGDQAALPAQLPNTGFSIAGTLALAFGLLVLLFGARRLRQI